jgi:hypothetical protein
MTVRCKFQCVAKNHTHTHAPDSVFCEIKLIPVWTGEDGANAAGSKATPQGQLTMGITNPAAIDEFDLGKFYYLDISPAE